MDSDYIILQKSIELYKRKQSECKWWQFTKKRAYQDIMYHIARQLPTANHEQPRLACNTGGSGMPPCQPIN